MAAGLRPDPLGELERSPRLPSPNSGGGVPTSKGEGREGIGKRERRVGKRKGRKGRGRRKGEGRTPIPDWESAKVATLADTPRPIRACSLLNELIEKKQ